jgi:hypothetical protein
MPEIPIQLQPQPKVRAHSRHLCEAERGIGGDASLLADNLVQARERHAEANGEGRLRYSQWLQEFLQKHFARVHWRNHSGQPTAHERSSTGGTPSGSP